MTTDETGTFIAYETRNFSDKRRKDIEAVNAIIAEYKGFVLSVRQVYYQFVQRGWIENVSRSYNYIQSIINDGRLAGLISWTAIEDRERSLMGYNTHSSPSAGLSKLYRDYKLDLWEGQRFRPEVWVEKKALEGVIGSICGDLRVDFYACKGYNSQSEAWSAGRRFADYVRKGQQPIVFHLGDHDPSGIDMTRDNRERLSMFAGTPIMVQRLALNMNQIEELQPPPNPAKLTDARAEGYIEQFGYQSWELDALDPKYIKNLIKSAIDRIREEDKFDAMLQREVDDRLFLREMIEMSGGKALD